MIVTHQNAEQLDFNKGSGLMVAIAQHALSGEVLMVAWMNREALARTLDERVAVFYSRSRQSLWRKGDTSGHTLTVQSILADCDRDALLLRVMPQGPACHTGARSCFLAETDSPETQQALAGDFLHRLEGIIDERIATAITKDNTEESYTARLLTRGSRRIAQKVGEEAIETALAGAAGDLDELRNESADLLFHWLLLLRQQGVSLDEVLTTLAERHRAR
ncbi:MAG: bifunctional phosphoribosyl-AMP cyclohydrolase/phosphoribosyl-ATP diphosphatase HisIE [Gammaproteobacteria bacterium]|jgi:phosphoribosyl-ATP pyrophosphohydrolase/phosphoribosyl-AMP cyclohydrolase|nr:bifunctional phosphoribosyl-AMP cyclohydrolase/phosphoribosyl-ATP diphosphatase HisIE [Gammaproteobacteria bacterium]